MTAAARLTRNGSTIGKTREDLAYEKTALLAALNHDLVARDLSEADRRHHRRRVTQISRHLSNWSAS